MQLELYKNQLKIGRVQPKINYIIMSERRKNMNLSDNLKKIRKEHNLSQEDLAESLGVSRQSVSKWESGQAYPEMDKVLQICKMFDVSIDDLLNQDIKKVQKEEKSKININKYVDDFLNYVTKAIDMFSNMKFKDVAKCIFEQLIIIILILILESVLGMLLGNLFRNLLFFLGNHAYNICFQIIHALYSILCIIIGMVIVLHIFKVRYLDYYEIIDKEELEDKSDIKQDQKESFNKKYISNKKEKIIIRDPNHSGYKFISALLKILLVLVKILTLFFVGFLCFTFISLIACFVISFMFVNNGVFFAGLILSITSCLLVNYILLDLLYHFYVNTKAKFTMLGVMFISSLVVAGIGVGLLLFSIPKFNVVNNADKNYFITDEMTYQMNDNMVIHDYYYKLSYVETDSNDVKIECTHSKIYDISFKENDNGYIGVEKNIDNEVNFIKRVIKDVSNNKIVNYDDMSVTIYTSKENIEKLKANKEKEYENEYERRIDELQRDIDLKENTISELQDRIYQLED